MHRIFMVTAFFSVFVSAQFMPRFSDDGLVQVNDAAFNEFEASPKMADWDGDGLNDLLIGYWAKVNGAFNWNTTDGRLKFLKNTGTNKSPVFKTAINLQAGGTELFASSG